MAKEQGEKVRKNTKPARVRNRERPYTKSILTKNKPK